MIKSEDDCKAAWIKLLPTAPGKEPNWGGDNGGIAERTSRPTGCFLYTGNGYTAYNPINVVGGATLFGDDMVICRRKELTATTTTTTADIALGKPVTCSGTSPANSVEYPCTAAVDGNAGTRWSGGPGAPNTWIEIDFQGNYDVASVGITFQDAYSKKFNICCGPTANPQGNCEEHQGREGAQEVSYLATGRYLRITNLEGREGNSGWGMSMYQLSVLGTPVTGGED